MAGNKKIKDRHIQRWKSLVLKTTFFEISFLTEVTVVIGEKEMINKQGFTFSWRSILKGSYRSNWRKKRVINQDMTLNISTSTYPMEQNNGFVREAAATVSETRGDTSGGKAENKIGGYPNGRRNHGGRLTTVITRGGGTVVGAHSTGSGKVPRGGYKALEDTGSPGATSGLE